MKQNYLGAIESASQILAEAFIKDLEAVLGYGPRLDREVSHVVREVGRGVLEQVYGAVASHLVAQYQEGRAIERHPRVSFKTLFGPVKVSSPYLWKQGEGHGVRPMKEEMGVEGGRLSFAVERALADFGSEKSFDRAARQFREHYGWEVGHGTVLRHTEACAEEAERYVEERLGTVVESYTKPPGVETLVAELDGCQIWTGVFMTAAQAGRQEREPHAQVCVEQWREVRTGFTRPLTETTRTYVCWMASYPEICN